MAFLVFGQELVHVEFDLVFEPITAQIALNLKVLLAPLQVVQYGVVLFPRIRWKIWSSEILCSSQL